MAREFGRSKKDEMLLSLLRRAGQVSQPSVSGRPNLPGMPTQKFRPVYSGSGRAGRDAARDEAMAARYRERGLPTETLEKFPELRFIADSGKISTYQPAFSDPNQGRRLDRSRQRIEQEIPQTRWDRNPNIPVGSYAEPMMEYQMEPMAPRDPYSADYEFDDPEETPEEQARLAKKWNTAFEDHERDMQLQGEMSMGPLTIDDRKEPGPLEKAITDSLKKKKK
tara:strand:+ start:45 stop:713 length:669 start_codon:yes stop_codon:yes gene_type:complete